MGEKEHVLYDRVPDRWGDYALRPVATCGGPDRCQECANSPLLRPDKDA